MTTKLMTMKMKNMTMIMMKNMTMMMTKNMTTKLKTKTYPLPGFSEASAFIIASKALGWTLGADLFILIKALS